MSNADVPRLCGGTFLTQLLKTKKPSSRSKAEGLSGEKDSVNNQRVLEALIHIFYPEFTITCDDTFKTDVSAYLACDKAQGTNLPFTAKHCGNHLNIFDSLIKTKYAVLLNQMVEFVDTYLKRDNIKSVVCALLQTIQEDTSITNDTVFYMGKMGDLTKAQLSQVDTVNLECFLLGIWHFILLNRPNNKVGRATFLEWNKCMGPGKPWEYVSRIGEDVDVHILRDNGDCVEHNAEEEPETVILSEDTEEYIPDGTISPSLYQYQQLIINNFYGAPGSNNVQYNYGTINIGVPAPLPAPSIPTIDKAEYYHLVVGYEFSKRIRVHTDRALTEHISDEVKNTFSFADPESMTGIHVLVMSELKWKKDYPTVKVGVVTKVKKQDNGVVLYIDEESEFPVEIIENNMELFGIDHIFELNRTHWTIKKINLEEAMEDAEING